MIDRFCLLIVSVLFFYLNPLPGQQNGNNPHGSIKWDCQQCHTAVSWKKLKEPIDFNHDQTGFPLEGVHEKVKCMQCHSNLKFTQVSINCATCHTDVHRGQLGIDCQRCHTPHGWKNPDEIYELHSNRGFPLLGPHTIADCNACHLTEQQNEFRGTPVDCYGCHNSEYLQAQNPNHVQASFSIDCQQCHQPTDFNWNQAVFEHTQTFELRGAHRRLDCFSCHSATFAGTPTDCYSCHNQDYQQTTSPSHISFGFRTDCTICHNENQWENAQFDHIQASGFELRGAHAFVNCIDCHVNNQQSGLPRDCYGCHQPDYQNVSDPNHVAGGFPIDCTICHSEAAWSPSSFDHNVTAFPLTGQHLNLECNSCHANGYAGTPIDCYDCHQQDYNNVTDPNHLANNFNLDCTQCHNTNAWSPATFDHNQTQFPLTGGHLNLQCIDCHSGGYTGTPTDCYACHQQDYNNVTDPNHLANNFSTDCTQCHSTNAWSPATFDHNQTQFPLTGAHLNLQCIDCHSGGYSGTPTDCWSCHQQDYINVGDPNHVINNFSHDCTQCHSTDAWSPATFDHNQTQFPLTGAHAMLPCLSCHDQGYAGTPTDCYSCHQQDYNNTTNPNHQAAGFPVDCEQCHNTIDWNQTTWDHDSQFFPIYSGPHNNEWTLCTECHVDPNNYSTFECIFCHEHNQQDMDDAHQEVQGYVYVSTECYACHPGGEE